MQAALKADLRDDCAFFRPPPGKTAITIDRIAESTHVPPGARAEDVGWHAVAVSFSDLAAGGARPLYVASSFGFSKQWAPHAEDIGRGMRQICRKFAARFVAGDTKSAPELEITTAAIGSAAHPMRRFGARDGDLLGVTGSLGRAALPFLLGGKARGAALSETLRFMPRIREGAGLSRIASACIDVSDGLTTSLHHLARASGKRIVLFDKSVPVDERLSAAAKKRGMWDEDSRWLAANFGGDYELAFTFPKRNLARAQNLLGEEFHLIGRAEKGAGVVDAAGERIADEGYEHLSDRWVWTKERKGRRR
jgi:thiamine-monophosphate kinase